MFCRLNSCGLFKLLKNSDLVGVSWGKTIFDAVAAMDQLDVNPPRNSRPITCFPLRGEALDQPMSHSASEVAVQLADIMNGEKKQALSLAGIPAMIPAAIEDRKKVSEGKELFRCFKMYSQIFGKSDSDRKKACIGKVDTILTSVGSAMQDAGFWSMQLAESAGVSLPQLKKFVLGDIAGVLIPLEKSADDSQSKIKDIQERWLGAELNDLKLCAKRAISTGKPGVIVLAIGSNKADVIYRILCEGVISHLFVDFDLATALQNKLQSGAKMDQ